MGSVEGADQCAAMCCGNGKFVACVNGSGGGRFIRRRFQRLPFDLLQEWGFSREPFDDLGEAVKGEKLIHAVTDLSKEKVIASTEGHLVALDIDSGEIEVIGEIGGSGRLAVGSKGNIFGLDEKNSLWCYNPENGKLMRNAVELPEGSWRKCRHRGATLRWAKDPVNGKLYTADGEGCIFSFTEEAGFSQCLGQPPLAPVGPMTVTFDGRVFGACGEVISNLFCYNPSTHELNGIGVADDYETVIYGTAHTVYQDKRNYLQNFTVEDANKLNIVLLHGSYTNGIPEIHREEVYFPFARDALFNCVANYIALGHYHACRFISEDQPIAAYPGSPDRCEALCYDGNHLVVTNEPGKIWRYPLEVFLK